MDVCVYACVVHTSAMVGKSNAWHVHAHALCRAAALFGNLKQYMHFKRNFKSATTNAFTIDLPSLLCGLVSSFGGGGFLLVIRSS